MNKRQLREARRAEKEAKEGRDVRAATDVRPVVTLPVGSYWMHHMSSGPRGTLVRINSENRGRYGVDYVQLTPDDRIIGGGASFSWPPEEFRPISDPLLHLAAQYHDADVRLGDLRKQMELLQARKTATHAAILALKATQDALADPPRVAASPREQE